MKIRNGRRTAVVLVIDESMVLCTSGRIFTIIKCHLCKAISVQSSTRNQSTQQIQMKIRNGRRTAVVLVINESMALCTSGKIFTIIKATCAQRSVFNLVRETRVHNRYK